MIKEFEKQIMLTKKVNEIISEINNYTDEIEKANEQNLAIIKQTVITEIQEIVDYCIAMNVEYEDFTVLDTKYTRFHFEHNKKEEIYEWYLGKYEHGVSYTICDGLFCVTNSFSKLNPVWSYGFLSHHDTKSEIVQYICSNWKDIKADIINKISKDISLKNERLLRNANDKLDKSCAKLIDSNNAL